MKYKRLTGKRNDGSYYIKKCDKSHCDGYCGGCLRGVDDEIRERLGQFEDKIEDGRIIELPCKVGDTVYVILGNKIYEDSVIGFNYVPSDYGLRFVLSFSSPVVEYLGDILFFTREEAEARLKELMGE